MNQTINPSISKLLLKVQKPLTYIAAEENAVFKDKSDFDICLIYPDLYELGIASLGLNILYSAINSQNNIWAQRAYMPDIDLQHLLKVNRKPLFSLEEQKSLNEFDILGFSLPSELCYTNILQMLNLSQIPIRALDRDDNQPLIIAGGNGAYNPLPLVYFIDAFVIGDGEEVIVEIADRLSKKKLEFSNKNLNNEIKSFSRLDKLQLLDEIDGVWVPQISTKGSIERRIVKDLNSVKLEPLIAITKGEMRSVNEIMRGCSAGCRFCQAGFINRPLREKSVNNILEEVSSNVCNHGLKQVSLLSLSTSDYSQIDPLVSGIAKKFKDKNVSISLPSLRMDDFSLNLLEKVSLIKKSSLTFAIEAGSQRLRDLINKGLSEQQILDNLKIVFEKGWLKVKLYFMIGLPTETLDDLQEIVLLINKIEKIAHYAIEPKNRRRLQITVSISNFVPKAHTPFQWVRQDSLDEFENKHKFLMDNIKSRDLKLRWHNPKQSIIEGIIARGDEKVAEVIEKAYLLGAQFDNFSEKFEYEIWENAFKKCNVDINKYLSERSMSTDLPWDFINCGLDKQFLKDEYENSLNNAYTPDCRDDKCSLCGVCDDEYINIFSDDITDLSKEELIENKIIIESPKKHRLILRKKGKHRFLSHLEWIALIERKMRQTNLALVNKGKFNPRPKLSFSQALPLGFSSNREFVDFSLSQDVNKTSLNGKLKAVFGDNLFVELTSVEKNYEKEKKYVVRLITSKNVSLTSFEKLIDEKNKNTSRPFRIAKKDSFIEIDLNVCDLKIKDNELLEIICPPNIRPDAIINTLAEKAGIVIEVDEILIEQ